MTSEEATKLLGLHEAAHNEEVDGLQHELRLLRNIAKRIVNFSKQLEAGEVRLEYQYAMILSELNKDALTTLELSDG